MFIVFLPFAYGRFGERDSHDGGMGKALFDGLVEGSHVVRKKTLADEAQGFDFLFFVRHDLRPSHGDGRAEFDGE